MSSPEIVRTSSLLYRFGLWISSTRLEQKRKRNWPARAAVDSPIREDGAMGFHNTAALPRARRRVRFGAQTYDWEDHMPGQNLVAIYSSRSQAEAARARLLESGIADDDIRLSPDQQASATTSPVMPKHEGG